MNYPGQDIREFFAGLAMQMFLKQWLENGWDTSQHPELRETIAQDSFLIADAMMEEGGHR